VVVCCAHWFEESQVKFVVQRVSRSRSFKLAPLTNEHLQGARLSSYVLATDWRRLLRNMSHVFFDLSAPQLRHKSQRPLQNAAHIFFVMSSRMELLYGCGCAG
jgi:hypothetical protein